MKTFGKKKKSHDDPSPVVPESDSGFYEPGKVEAPLDEYSTQSRSGAYRRATRGRVPQRRENNVRATDLQLAWLVIKIVLIPVLSFAGYLGLKMAVEHFTQPSDERIERWERNAAVMDQGGALAEAARGDSLGFGDKDALALRLDNLERAQQLLRSAEALDLRGMDAEATDRLEQALAFAPENTAVQTRLLDLYIRLENYEEAIPLGVRLLNQDSQNRQAGEHLLTALHETGSFDAGLVLAERMLDDDPDNLHVMELAAYFYAALGQPDKALVLYRAILDRNNSHLLALEGSGAIYEWRKQWAEALPYYMELLKLAPEARHYQALARNCAQQNEPGKTVIFLGQAASLYGQSAVSPWLRDPTFDSVRESAEFRSFADQIVGVQTRAAIEQVRRREVKKPTMDLELESTQPSQMLLEILRPNRR